MKKIGSIISLALLLVMLSSVPAFAAGLKLEDSYPKDGGRGVHPENVMVKLYFNEDVSGKAVRKSNESCFVFKDEKGKVIPTRALYNDKNLNQIWVLVDQALESDSVYHLEVSGDLQMTNGDALGEDKVIEFRIRNTGMDTKVNMGLMFAMMGGMVVFTSLSTRRTMKKEEATNEDHKVNPYKVAKETGKSVEDIVAKTEKVKQKARAKAEKEKRTTSSAKEKSDNAESSKVKKDTKRVTQARPISASGSTYITGRKAAAEKAAERAAAKAKATTTNPKNATGKSKNKKPSN